MKKNRLKETPIPELYYRQADYIDIKTVEGNATLRQFIAAMLSYYPRWLILLYGIRSLLVRLLGLAKQENPQSLARLKSEDVSFTAGETVTFFTVRSAEESRFWIAETPTDKHLKAYFAVLCEASGESQNRFLVMTAVFYKHWTGPVYFNLIRPFHHLVVYRMARRGASSTAQR